VSRYGPDLFHAFNAMLVKPRGFAGGGLVDSPSPAQRVEMMIGLDEGLRANGMSGADGDKVLIHLATRNRRALRNLLK